MFSGVDNLMLAVRFFSLEGEKIDFRIFSDEDHAPGLAHFLSAASGAACPLSSKILVNWSALQLVALWVL